MLELKCRICVIRLEKTNGVSSQWRILFADKQKENEKLRESLSRKTANLERLQRELACVKGEKERLQQEVGQREQHNQQLRQELCASRSELSR